MQKIREMPKGKKIALLVVLFYAFTFPVMGYMSYLFLQNTVLDLQPNADSLVGRSLQAGLHEFHHGQVFVRPFAMMLVNYNTSQPIAENPDFKLFSDYANAAVYGTPSEDDNGKTNDTNTGSLAYMIESFDSYFTIPDYVAFMRERVIGGDNNETTIMQMEIRGSVDMHNAVRTLVRWVKDYEAANRPSFEIRTTSITQVFDDLADGIIYDLLKVDAVSLPMSVLILIICVGSFRMVHIPGVLVPVTLVFSFGLMYPISLLMTISSLAPEMSAAVLLAITVDYSLFFSTRFMDETSRMRLLRGAGATLSYEDKYEVVRRTTTLTAHNVVVSGFTIAISLAGISLLPADFIRAIGLVFALGACVAVGVTMALVPSMLLVFYDYFSAPAVITKANMKKLFAKIRAKCCCCCDGGGKYEEIKEGGADPSIVATSAGAYTAIAANESSSDAAALAIGAAAPPAQEKSHLLASPTDNHHVNRVSYNVGDEKQTTAATEGAEGLLVDKTANAAEREAFLAAALADQRSSFWYKAATLATRFPYLTIVFLFAAAAPFVYFATTIKTDFVIANQVPRGAKHVKILHDVQETVGHGTTFPFTAVFVGHGNDTVLTDPFFNKTQDFMNRIHKRCNQQIDNVLTFAALPGLGPISADFAKMLLIPGFPGGEMYSFLFNRTVNRDHSAGIVKFTPSFNPFGSDAYEYLNGFQEVIDVFAKENADIFSFVGVIGSSAVTWQIMVDVLADFPMQIGITFAVIFLLIAFSFRSFFIPIRMLVTVGYTVVIAYGAGVMLFQHKWVWHIWPAMEGVTAYSWTCPIFSFSLLCALALDYDIFLLTRVVEMKKLGYTDRAAIIKAVYKTGRIISFAGLIMSVAFGALMFASVVLLNQYAFVAFVAVLVDTFVVRTFLVPALMSIMPAIVWWPRKFEAATREVDDMDI